MSFHFFEFIVGIITFVGDCRSAAKSLGAITRRQAREIVIWDIGVEVGDVLDAAIDRALRLVVRVVHRHWVARLLVEPDAVVEHLRWRVEALASRFVSQELRTGDAATRQALGERPEASW